MNVPKTVRWEWATPVESPGDAGGQREDAEGEVPVPEPEERHPPPPPPHPHAREGGDHVVGEPDEERREGPPDHAVDVDRAEATEGQPGRLAEEVRVVELGRDEDADGGREEQPRAPPPEPASNQRPVDQPVVPGRLVLSHATRGLYRSPRDGSRLPVPGSR